MLAIAAYSAVGSARALAREIVLPGAVVDVAIRQATDGALFYRPVVAVVLPDGVRRTLQASEERTDTAYEVDQAVSVAYDPLQPQTVRIRSADSAVGPWIVPIITGMLGVVFLATTLFARRVLRD